MTPQISKAQIADLPRLNAICLASKMHWGYPQEWIDRWRPDLTRSQKDLEEQSIYKIENEVEIFGYCAILEDATNYEVTNLWVLPSYIGQGFGRLLLEKTMEIVVQKAKPILVEADPNAETFYARQGFVTYAQKESYPPGRFLPLMKKEA